MSITVERSIVTRAPGAQRAGRMISSPRAASAASRDDRCVSTGELHALFDTPAQADAETAPRALRRRSSDRPRTRPETARRGPAVGNRAVGTRCSAPAAPLQSVYLRRRRTATAIAAGVALALSVWIVAILGSSYQQAVAPEPTGTAVVHVRGGESLGAVAERVAPDMPTQVVIDEIIELNDLQSSGLRIGQPLLTPEYR